MKKIVCYALAATMLLTMNGCSGGTAHSALSTSEVGPAVDADETVREYIEANLPEDIYVLLAEDSYLSVLEVNGEIDITVNASSDFAIPYVAQEALPLAQEAIADAGATLGSFQAQHFRENGNGIIDGSMTNWRTRDGEKGTFVSEPDGVTRPGMTIDDLLEYYADYDELVQDMRAGKYDE